MTHAIHEPSRIDGSETADEDYSAVQNLDAWPVDDSTHAPEPGDGLPPAPITLPDCGLSGAYLSDLILKHLYRYGILTGLEIAERVALSFLLLDGLLREMILNQYAEKRGGQGMGNATDRYSLTERGRSYTRDLLEQDTYTGPAPIPLDQYRRNAHEHDLRSVPITQSRLREAWRDLILDEILFAQVGPAIRSGKSCFLYGPPGTGKTTMAKKIAEFLDRTGGHYAVPHALLVGGSVIRVYDPVHHEKVEDQESHRASSSWLMENPGDRRWVLCRRPAVIVGGELSLDMLDLRYNPATKYYEAPLQVKANGGVLIVDDFGRQLVQPRDLLNRWIIPLEERIDYLTLHTGKKFAIPFDPLVVFATNLDPAGLVDEAFLRRIRYKIYIGEPSIDMYKRIFIAECKKKGLVIDPSFIEEIIHRCYRPNHRPLRACDPRDITDQIADYCAFHELPLRIPYELVEKTAAGYLSDLKTG